MHAVTRLVLSRVARPMTCGTPAKSESPGEGVSEQKQHRQVEHAAAASPPRDDDVGSSPPRDIAASPPQGDSGSPQGAGSIRLGGMRTCSTLLFVELGSSSGSDASISVMPRSLSRLPISAQRPRRSFCDTPTRCACPTCGQFVAEFKLESNRITHGLSDVLHALSLDLNRITHRACQTFCTPYLRSGRDVLGVHAASSSIPPRVSAQFSSMEGF